LRDDKEAIDVEWFPTGEVDRGIMQIRETTGVQGGSRIM
jgi:hypothetical protein